MQALPGMSSFCQARSSGNAKRVFALLQTAAMPGQCPIHLIYTEGDLLCDWQPNQMERHVVSHRLDCKHCQADPINGWVPQNTN